MPAEPYSENAYEILGVPPGADVPAIRRAFRKLAMKFHPDARPQEEKEEATEVFARINQAHELLRDPEKREPYDRMLARGVVPELFKEVGEGAAEFASLADIIGEIRSLDIPRDQWQRLSGMEAKLRDELLRPNLIKGEELREKLVDAVTVSTIMEQRNFDQPPGELKEGWLVVTELRVIFLGRFVHEYQDGNTKYTETHYRFRAFPYWSMTDMKIVEHGRVGGYFSIELEDEDETWMKLKLGELRLSRLFLVANTYRLPLKVEAEGSRGGEYATTVFAPPAVAFGIWSIPFIVTLVFGICALCGSGDKDSPVAAWPTIYSWMTSHYLTTLGIYLAPIAVVWMLVQTYCSWDVAQPEQVFGELGHDFAGGSGILDPDAVGLLQHDGSDDEPDEEPDDEPDWDADEEPDDEADDEPDDEGDDEGDDEPDDERDDQPDEEYSREHEAADETPSGPVDVQMPSAILEALGVGRPSAPPPSPSTGPVPADRPAGRDADGPGRTREGYVSPSESAGLETEPVEPDEPGVEPGGEGGLKNVFCPKCGKSYGVDPGTAGHATCRRCGTRFEIE